MYLVNQSRIALPMEALYSPDMLRLQMVEQPATDGQEAPLPLSPDGTLVAGQLYPSSADASVSYYLPTYQVRVLKSGLYQATLKWTPDASDPSIGLLTIDLEAQVPGASGVQLQEIPHDAVARLRYRLPDNAAAQNDTPDSSDPANLPPFVMELGPLVPLGPSVPNVRRCQLPVPTKQIFDRIYEIMTDRAFGGMLEIRYFAVVGRRTWRQIVVDDGPSPIETPPLRGRVGAWGMATRSPFRVARTPVVLKNPRLSAGVLSEDSAPASAPAELFRLIPAQLEAGAAHGMTLGDDAMAMRVNLSQLTMLPAVPARPVAQPIVAAPIASPIVSVLLPVLKPGAIDASVLQPDTQVAVRPLAESLASSDLMLSDGNLIRRAIPIGAYVGRNREPVLLRVPVEARQNMPFFFRVDVNGYMFDVPADFTPTISSRLEQKPFSTIYNNAVMSAMFYHDLGLGTYYYQPTEFRLARTARAPDQTFYHPYLAAALQNVVTQDDSGTTKTTCQVNLSYQALPYIDPILLALAAAAFGQSANKPLDFAPLQPVGAPKLTLHLPTATAGVTLDLPRPDVSINFDAGAGFADVLTRSLDDFEPILSALTTNVPIGGTVEIQLLNNIKINVPLRLSLKDTAGALFDSTFNGKVGDKPDQYGVTLLNRVESPVHIERLDPVLLGPGQLASPQNGAGATVDVGQSQQIIYATPAGASVTRIDPILIGSVTLDGDRIRALWAMLLANEGYSSTNFTVNVEFDTAFPWAQQDGAALVGLRVEFDCSVKVSLKPDAPKQPATLQQGYLPMILGDWQGYRYRVINELAGGDGAQSDWQYNAGDLKVQPA